MVPVTSRPARLCLRPTCSSPAIRFLVSVLALILSGREANAEYSFGYHRAEVLGAVASIFVVWLMTGILVWEAITRLITPVRRSRKLPS